MTMPLPVCRSAGRHAWVRKNWARRLTAYSVPNCCGVTSSKGRFIVMPALLTSTSRPPRNPSASPASRRTFSTSRKSARIAAALSPELTTSNLRDRGISTFHAVRVVEHDRGSFPGELQADAPTDARSRSRHGHASSPHPFASHASPPSKEAHHPSRRCQSRYPRCVTRWTSCCCRSRARRGTTRGCWCAPLSRVAESEGDASASGSGPTGRMPRGAGRSRHVWPVRRFGIRRRPERPMPPGSLGWNAAAFTVAR